MIAKFLCHEFSGDGTYRRGDEISRNATDSSTDQGNAGTQNLHVRHKQTDTMRDVNKWCWHFLGYWYYTILYFGKRSHNGTRSRDYAFLARNAHVYIYIYIYIYIFMPDKIYYIWTCVRNMAAPKSLEVGQCDRLPVMSEWKRDLAALPSSWEKKREKQSIDYLNTYPIRLYGCTRHYLYFSIARKRNGKKGDTQTNADT